MSLGNRSHCSRGLNGRAMLCGAVNSPRLDGVSQPALPRTEIRKVRDCGTRALPGTLTPQGSLRALFEGPRLTAQKRERFTGEMEGAGNQDTLAGSLRSRDRFGNGWSDGVGE